MNHSAFLDNFIWNYLTGFTFRIVLIWHDIFGPFGDNRIFYFKITWSRFSGIVIICPCWQGLLISSPSWRSSAMVVCCFVEIMLSKRSLWSDTSSFYFYYHAIIAVVSQWSALAWNCLDYLKLAPVRRCQLYCRSRGVLSLPDVRLPHCLVPPARTFCYITTKWRHEISRYSDMIPSRTTAAVSHLP